MRAVTLAGPGEVDVREVPEPRLADPADVIVQVELAGICGTDLHAVRGDLPGLEPGAVLGHEFVGTVIETGSAVSSLRVGQRVLSSDFTACGTCWYCRQGRHWHCPHRQFFGTGTAFGPVLPGAQAERVRVPWADTTLGPLPAGVSDEAALLLGDNLATGWIAATESGLAPGDVVAVLGGGAVGQLASLSCQLLGAGVVVVSDPVPSRQRLAADQGAVASTPQALTGDLAELTEGRGADVVIEAVGVSAGLDAALRACRPGGTVVSVSAHSQPEWNFPLADSFARELALRFVIGDSIRVRRELLRVLRAGILDPAGIISGRRSLDDAIAGYGDLREFRGVKVLLAP